MTEVAGAMAEEPQAPARPSAWMRFWDRFLPHYERRDVLWMALGGAAISILVTFLRGLALSLGIAESQSVEAAAAISRALTFSITFLLVFVAIRLLRAPRVLALYIAVSTLVVIGAQFLTRPYMTWVNSVTAETSFAAALGRSLSGAPVGIALAMLPALAAVLGAWLADVTRHGRGGPLRAIGWTSPLNDSARRALALALVVVIPQLVLPLALYGSVTLNALRGLHGEAAFRTSPLVSAPLSALWALAWVFSAWLVVRRFRGPRGLWLAAPASDPNWIGAAGSAVALVVPPITQGGLRFAAQVTLFAALGSALIALFAILGVWLATRGEPAIPPASDTLPAEGTGGAA